MDDGGIRHTIAFIYERRGVEKQQLRGLHLCITIPRSMTIRISAAMKLYLIK